MSFLDYRCDNCSEEEHDTCWVDNPDFDCVCCRETMLIIIDAEIQGYVRVAYGEAHLQ